MNNEEQSRNTNSFVTIYLYEWQIFSKHLLRARYYAKDWRYTGMSHVRLPLQNLHLTYYTDETCGDICLGSSLISYQSLHPLIFWESQDHHIRLSSPSFLITYIFISTGTDPLIHLCSHRGRDGLPMTKLALFFGPLPLSLLRDNAPSVISLSHYILIQLIWTGSLLSIKTYFSPSCFINTFLSSHNFYIISFDRNFFSSWSSISRSLKEQSIPSL